MSEARVTYSLLDEPWIPCLLEDGNIREFGLKRVFAEAVRVRDIAGELPTQTFAIARLLLAILHQTLGEELETRHDWGKLWQNGLPVDAVHAYLEDFRERFDLLHPEMPFYQVAGLRTEKNEVKGVAALLFDVPSNFRLFTGRAGAALEDLSFAEAARWLVHVHAYDVSGIHSGMVGDDRVKGGKGYGIGTGWAGELGGVLVEGRSLAETLVLNLVPRTGDRVVFDVPPWERPQDNAAARPDEAPRGSVDLLTWQSRRVRLVHDGMRVTGCLIGNGDKISAQNQHGIEPLTAWRFSKAQTQKNKGVPVYMPSRHQPERAFWRGITGLTVQRTGKTSAQTPPLRFPPPVLSWLIEMQENEMISPGQYISPRAIGVEYGTQSSVVTDVFDDRLFMPLAVLDAEQHPALSAAARAAVDASERGVFELGKLAGNLALAAGGDPDGPLVRAKEEAFMALDMPFRGWLAELDPLKPDSAGEALNSWIGIVDQIMRQLAETLVNAAGAAAWQGRVVRRPNREDRITTSIAEHWFDWGLKRALTRLETETQLATGNDSQKEGADG